MRLPTVFSLTLLLAVAALCQDDAGYVPKAGYVPDARTAVQVAEAVLVPIYGKKQIESERPFTATLKNDVWTVAGSLRCPDGKGGTTTQCNGGVAVVRISRGDARILYVMHGSESGRGYC
jgi:hypothetical protein